MQKGLVPLSQKPSIGFKGRPMDFSRYTPYAVPVSFVGFILSLAVGVREKMHDNFDSSVYALLLCIGFLLTGVWSVYETVAGVIRRNK